MSPKVRQNLLFTVFLLSVSSVLLLSFLLSDLYAEKAELIDEVGKWRLYLANNEVETILIEHVEGVSRQAYMLATSYIKTIWLIMGLNIAASFIAMGVDIALRK